MRLLRRDCALTVLLLLGLSTGRAEAQYRRPPRGLREVAPAQGRRGPFFSFGFGAGDESYDVSGDAKGYSNGLNRPVFTASGGGAVGRKWELGGEVDGWLNDINGVNQVLGSAMLITNFFPSDRGFFLKGGAGFSFSSFDYGGGVSTSQTGFAWTVGTGVEVPVGRRLSLVPNLQFQQYHFDGAGFQPYRERIITVGVNLRFGFNGRRRGRW